MTKEQLIDRVKLIMGMFRAGQLEQAYEAFAQLVMEPGFVTLRPEERRQALKMLVHGKRPELSMNHPLKAEVALDAAVIASHRAALQPLTELVSTVSEPEDFEMLGMVHQRLGNLESASSIYRVGLNLERERSPASDLCGALMTRLSSI